MDRLVKVLKKPADATPHLMIAACMTLLTLFVTDRFNGAMNFVAHELTAKFIIVTVCVFIYQTAVYCVDFIKCKKLIAVTAINILGCVLGIYLLRLCYIDLTTEMIPHMLKETNKYRLLGFTALALVGSVATIFAQRSKKIKENRKNAIKARRKEDSDD